MEIKKFSLRINEELKALSWKFEKNNTMRFFTSSLEYIRSCSSTFSPSEKSLYSICNVSNANVVSLTAVPLWKPLSVPRRAPDASCGDIKRSPTAKTTSVNLNHVSIFKLSSFSIRAIHSFANLVPAKSADILLNRSLWSLESLIKEPTPRDKARHTNSVVSLNANSWSFPQAQ